MRRMRRTIKGIGFIVLISAVLFVQHQSRGSQALGEINLLSVTPRIITPNGDGKNDRAFFNFDQHLTGLSISGEVFDLQGAKVGDLSVFDGDDTKMTWNGKDDEGVSVRSGIYIYQIKLGGSRLTGTVVVAK